MARRAGKATRMLLQAVQAGEGEGPPVVLLHGLFGAAQNFGAIQRRLARRRRIVALDLRNHGNSPHADAMDYPTLAADVAETLEALAATPAALVGHSMGGKVAMTVALSRPAAVAKLVAADIAPIGHGSTLRPYITAMRSVPLEPALTRQAADAVLARTIPEPAIRAFLLLSLRFTPDGPRWRLNLPAIEAGMPAIEGFPDDLPPRYDGPTLSLAGGRSAYVGPDGIAAFEARFPAVRFEIVGEAGHWLHAEQPDAFVTAIEAFLDTAG